MIDDLSMAHDNLQRELSDIKRLMSKDKHELIKSNIALNKRVQELESFKNSVEYTVDSESLELIIKNQNSEHVVSYSETYDEKIYLLQKRVQELEDAVESYKKTSKHANISHKMAEEQLKRYREAIDKIKGELYKMSAWGKEEISMLDIIYDLEGEG